MWLEESMEALQASATNRTLNGVVAVSLLDRFRDDPDLWRDCAVLNEWDVGRDPTFREFLDSWTAYLPTSRRNVRAPMIIRDMFDIR